MSWRKATWKKGKKTLTGMWYYNWAGDSFWVHLDGKDPETGLRRESFDVKGENPEFNGWKLVEGTPVPKDDRCKCCKENKRIKSDAEGRCRKCKADGMVRGRRGWRQLGVYDG